MHKFSDTQVTCAGICRIYDWEDSTVLHFTGTCKSSRNVCVKLMAV